MDNADYGKARYQWLKAHGICVSCGNADAEPGRVRCERCLQVRRDLSSAWKRKNPERVKAYQQTYQPLYRQRTYLPGAGQLVTNRKPKIHKPDGTCRRKGCWESALPFSCWCRAHLDEMRERRWRNDCLRRIASASTAKCSPQNGW